ncbi:hypothetical protein SNE40_000089 [Patella caerulea]|uniref:G-protein coupled receptors family 1 profile domain-containing protein n=1 Tax=Patella caerulea TaxID=87958 RepID=A0AAN8Q6J6_PATCE
MDNRLNDLSVSEQPNLTLGHIILDDTDYQWEPDILSRVTTCLTLYLQPVICVFGVLGNLISFFVFSSAKMRTISSNIYLAGLSASNSAFLLALFVVWLEITGVRLIHQEGWCQAVIYTSYVCSFLSVWLIVCIAIENYIITFHLSRASKLCTVSRTFLVVIGLSVFSLLLYDFALWSTKIVVFNSTSYCIVPEQYGTVVAVFTIVDIVVTLVLPSIVLMILIIAVFVKNVSHLRHPRPNIRHTTLSRKERSLLRVTRLLFVISVSYLLLTLPSHVNKLRHLFTTEMSVSISERAVQHLFQLLYYASFSCNFIYYLIWGRNFREFFRNWYILFKKKEKCRISCC